MAVHVIGLTGGIASGKSTVARMLAERGAAVIDADLLARQVVEPGEPALAELIARFGTQILTATGTLDRKRLGAIAFADPVARVDLGHITHPRIAAASAAAIAALATAGANVVFYEAALLVENRAYSSLAGLVVVSTPPEVQHARLVVRDGLSSEEATARIAAQAPLADKLAAATWVVENPQRPGQPGEHAALEIEVAKLVAKIEARFGAIALPKPRVRRNHETGRFSLTKRDVALVTGFPAFTAKRMLGRLLDPPGGAPPPDKLFILAPGTAEEEATQFATTLANAARVEILVGDVCDMDLGLSSVEYRTLSREVTWIHHVAGITAKAVGTQNVLELARDAAKLERVVHWSTIAVSGDHRGTYAETDLDGGQSFHDDHERTRFAAEKLVRAAMRQLPITVLRPGIIVGDSTTGQIELTDETDGLYGLIALIATNASGLRLPLLGRGDRPLQLVPVDFVVDAAWHVVRSEGAAGKTFHLVDATPMTTRAVFEAVATYAHTAKPRGSIPLSLARVASRIGRKPLVAIDALDHPARYDDVNTQAALAGTGVCCPALADYLPQLVQFVLDANTRTPRTTDDVSDPLA